MSVCDSHHFPDVLVERLPLAVVGKAMMRKEGGGRTVRPLRSGPRSQDCFLWKREVLRERADGFSSVEFL